MSSSSSASISEEFELIDRPNPNVEPEDLQGKLQSWLQPTDYTAESSEFRRHLSSQAPGTGLWICDTARYQQWHQSDEHGSLWVKGVPGAGKSVLAASMVEHLQNNNTPVLFFFFRYIIASNRKPRNLIQDYLAQLLPYSPILKTALWSLLDTELDHHSDERLWDFLLLGLGSISAYCIVDAMDEMETDHSFLQRLNDLAIFRPKSVKLFMTSRPKQYLQSALRDASIVHVSLEDDLVGKDIAVFVAQRLRAGIPGDQNQQLREDLESTICERSQGLFLYARLLVDQIIPQLHSADRIDVQKLAKTLPVGLEEMYKSMLYQNSQSQKVETEVQVFLLKLVTHSSRPLRLNELADVVAFKFPLKQWSGTPKQVARTACAPLLEILEDETVQVIHHSFTEFLLDQSRQGNRGGSTPQFPTLNPLMVHRDLALVSLAYLESGVLLNPEVEDSEERYVCDCDGDFDCPTCQKRGENHAIANTSYDWQASKLRFPFLEYAALNWAFHCHNYDVEDPEFLKAVSGFLNPQSASYRQWLRIEWTTRNVSGAAEIPTPLHISAFAGMTKFAALLLRENQAVNARDAVERTPLHWACIRGHVDVVSLLLAHGAAANAEDCGGVSPIHVAARRNHSLIVKLLLEAGVDPMTPKSKQNHGGRLLGGEISTKGETAPGYACKQGHLDTIIAMLPYLKLESLGEVLGRACRHGEFEIAKAVLTNTSVSPNAKFDGGTALYIATVAQNAEIVKLLLSSGADALEQCAYYHNYRSGGGRFGRSGPMMAPIHAAISCESDQDYTAGEKILKLLLEAGANIEAKNGNGDTALLKLFGSRTSVSYHAVRYLLEAGAQVTAVDKNGDCVLIRCLATCKDLDIIKLMLRYGAKIDVRSHQGDTVLHKVLECSNGRWDDSIQEILTFFLEKGSNPDVANNHGRTALEKAMLTWGCTFEAIRALLQNCGPTAAKRCMWLLRQGKSDEEAHQLIRLLLAHGASLEDRNSLGKTPILNDPRSRSAVEALRQCGANVHAVDNQGRGLLHNYIYIGGSCPHLEGFTSYVAYGLDTAIVDRQGDTLLHAAAGNYEGTKTEVEFIEYLLSCGNEINARNKKGETPLMVNIRLGEVRSSSDEQRVPFLDLLRRHEKDDALNLDNQDNDGLAAIHLATLRSEFQLSPLLSAGVNTSLVTKERRTILHVACRARQTNTVALIVNKCKELLDIQDAHGRTPLHDACTSGRPEIVFCLLRAGASIHLRDNNNKTPLHACASFPIEQKLWSLLEYQHRIGSDPILPGIETDPFRPGAARGHDDKPWYSSPYMSSPQSSEHDTTRIGGIIDMLLEAGSDPRALDNRDRSPLDLAISNDCTEMIAKLTFTADERMKTSTLKEEEKKKLPILLTLKTLPKGPRLDQLDTQTMQEILDKPRTWMKFLYYPSFCESITDQKETAFKDPKIVNKLAQQGASNGLTELMSTLGPLASMNDNHADVLKRITPAPSGSRVTLSDHAPILQTACSCTSYNLQTLQVLVETCKVDVNARALTERQWQIPPGEEYYIAGPTALHILSKANSFWQLSGIRYLVTKGADVNALNEKGETPLQIASQGDVKSIMGDSEGFWTGDAVKMLLELGADPNILDAEGSSCLNKASSSPKIMTLLLAYGADMNLGEVSPLFSSIKSQDLEALRVLLDAGVDPNSEDEKQGFQLHYTGKEDMKRHALFCACFANLFNQSAVNSAPLVKLLIQRGANSNAILGPNETLIHYVFEDGEEEIVFAFLDPDIQGMIDWEKKDQLGRTVLLAAANWTGAISGYRHKHWFEKRRGPVLQLLDLEVNPLAVDHDGKNALHHLCANEDTEEDFILQFLDHPSASSLVSQTDKSGYTPLHFALKVLRPKVIEKILEMTSQENLLDPDPEGKTALHHIAAQCVEHHERQRANHNLREHPLEWYTDLCNLWTKFLYLGGDLNVRDAEGNSPFLTLLSQPTHYRNTSCHSPENPHLSHLDKFFQDADVRVRNKKGENGLHVVAMKEEDEEDEDIDIVLFEVLTKRGLDPLEEDGEGRTSLDVAAARGKDGILGLFERGGGR